MKNINRIKNILKGDYTKKTKISVTKSPKKIKHNEGDIWEENGKQWTIENGIKKSITKLQSIRNKIIIPLTCPKCNKPLKSQADKKMYQYRQMCLNCVANEDTNKIINGTFKSELKNKTKQNIKAYLKDFKEQIDDYIDNFDSNNTISDDGTIEDWEQNITKDQLKNKLYAEYEKLKNKLLNKKTK